MRSTDRYEFLDAARGAACLAVAAFHAANDGGSARGSGPAALLADLCRLGWLGVPVFFAVSGYCVAAAAERHRARGLTAADFARRRFWRIVPPYWAALALYAAALGLLPAWLIPADAPLTRPGELRPVQWLGSATLSEEWRPEAGVPRRWFLIHAWTLAYELQFYAVIGLILAVRPSALWPALAALTVAIYANVGGAPLFPTWPGFFWGGLWLPFAAGASVYAADRHGTPLLRGALAVVLLLATAGAANGTERADWFGQSLRTTLAAACAASLGMLLGRRWDGLFASARWLAPLRWAGRRCYSLYLVHPLVAVPVAWRLYANGVSGDAGVAFVAVPLAVAASLPAAELFHRAVERPCLRLAGR